MDGRRVVQRLVNGETALEIARSFGYRSPTPGHGYGARFHRREARG